MIPISRPFIGHEELELVNEAVASGWVSSQGKYVKQFESDFADYIGCKYAIATSSGTTALHLALSALGIGKGDKVIVPAMTFIASANVVTYCGAQPVFSDIHPDYWCINPNYVERILHRNSSRIRAIMPVHLYGHSAEMGQLLALAEKYNLFVVEDACEAIGAKYQGKMVGSLSHISAFSFYGNKVCVVGEGGMCVTDSKEFADTMRTLRDHGQCSYRKYWHDCIGFNFRMTNLSAALGVAQLGKVDGMLMARNRVRQLYDLLLPKNVVRMPKMTWCEPINWLYTCLLPEGVDRDKVIEKMAKDGIETRPMFYPLNLMPPYHGLGSFPIAEEISKRGISLPTYPDLSPEDIKKVVESLHVAMTIEKG